ncbi:MAG: UDP-galactopyranose mutase [Suipraeoptans sp.]
MMYDYIIVGAGLFGAVFAHEAKAAGRKVMVIDKRSHIAGNAYTKDVDGIHVHEYGAHIFHTSNKKVWNYVNQFAEFNNYINSPVAIYKDELYNMPFNMYTFYKMWGTKTPVEAKAVIEAQVKEAGIVNPSNLEEQAISLVGKDIYEKLVKGYTQKQWGKLATELPAFIIKRLPVRFTYDNNYFNDTYQGIPIGGYTRMVEKMLEGVEVKLNTDFYDNKDEYLSTCDKVIFTGMIDEYYDYCLGKLEYRGLKFETEVLAEENHQGNAVVNYNEYEVPYTRIIEHKHFMKGEETSRNKTIVTREYPLPVSESKEPYYPINDDRNTELYAKYKDKATTEEKVIFGGRLGMYRYFDMHQVIDEALDLADSIL